MKTAFYPLFLVALSLCSCGQETPQLSKPLPLVDHPQPNTTQSNAHPLNEDGVPYFKPSPWEITVSKDPLLINGKLYYRFTFKNVGVEESQNHISDIGVKCKIEEGKLIPGLPDDLDYNEVCTEAMPNLESVIIGTFEEDDETGIFNASVYMSSNNWHIRNTRREAFEGKNYSALQVSNPIRGGQGVAPGASFTMDIQVKRATTDLSNIGYTVSSQETLSGDRWQFITRYYKIKVVPYG